MALPAPVIQQGPQEERKEHVELGTIGVSLATQPQAWPLGVAANLLDGYRLRDARLPDLDPIVASRTIECHTTPDVLQSKAYAPFTAIPTALPPAILAILNRVDVSSQTTSADAAGSARPDGAVKRPRVGYLRKLNTVWVTDGEKVLFWDVGGNEVKEFSTGMADPVVSVDEAAPNNRVFSESVKQLLAVSTTKEMRLFAVEASVDVINTELSIPIDGLGAPTVRSSAEGRIWFTCEETGATLWEFRYSAKESWFKSKQQRVCHGEVGGVFGGLFGSVTPKSSERMLDFALDDSVNALYILTTTSIIHVYHYDPHGNMVTLTHTINPGVVRSKLSTFFGAQAPNFVSVSAVPLTKSREIRLVAVTDAGARVFFHRPDRRSYLQIGYAHKLPTSNDEATPVLPKSTVLDGEHLFAVAESRILASSIDRTRIAHQTDMRQPVSFVELSGWFRVEGTVQFVLPSATDGVTFVLTTAELYRVRARPFSERFEYADVPLALAQVYGPMEICCGALITASQSTSRQYRENAIGSFFRFGGLPVFRRDQLQTGFLGHSAIRLSSMFDGLALYVARLLAPIWASHILGPDNKVLHAAMLDKIHQQLSGLSDFLDKNRSFSEGMSERTGSYAGGDDAALLSQAEYKGLQAMSRLAKSSQQGIAFLRLTLTQHDTKNVLSYFSESSMQKLRKMKFGEFFTEAKQSDVVRELVNSLVNYVLNKGDSIDSVASVMQERCPSYFSGSDVLEYKALEYIHHAKQQKHPDTASLNRSVTLVKKASASIQLETLTDIVRDYVQLKFYVGAIQASLAVAAEQDPANLAIGYLRQKDSVQSVEEPTAKKRLTEVDGAVIPTSTDLQQASHASQASQLNPPQQPSQTQTLLPSAADGGQISESELKYRTKMAVFNILFTEVLTPHTNLADVDSPDAAARAAMLSSQDEVWHFALYDWFLEHGRQDQIALLDTPFVATYLQVGAVHDLRVANLLWKWHQRHGDLLAAADVLLDLARGTLASSLAQRIEYLSRAMGYCQAQQQPTPQAVNMTTMVRAYLGLALLQADILAKVPDERLNQRLYNVSELFNQWADPLGLYEVSFEIFEFADYRDPVEIQQCWQNLLTKTRVEDDKQHSPHYAHVAALVTQLGTRYRAVESIFSVSKLVPMLEQYTVDYTRDAPQGWLIDAFAHAGIAYNVLYDTYESVLKNKMLEGEAAEHAKDSLRYLNSRWAEEDPVNVRRPTF